MIYTTNDEEKLINKLQYIEKLHNTNTILQIKP